MAKRETRGLRRRQKSYTNQTCFLCPLAPCPVSSLNLSSLGLSRLGITDTSSKYSGADPPTDARALPTGARASVS